ncbi:hypothetical protein PSAB6_50234 [Paraburkholderia sabiae]|nr:hypothetical protein PSAB6_50234 [Paraburkholderia sabiae]
MARCARYSAHNWLMLKPRGAAQHCVSLCRRLWGILQYRPQGLLICRFVELLLSVGVDRSFTTASRIWRA